MPDIRALDFNLLLTFDAVYEERSLTRAAQRLAVTQPTVSGSLGRLRGVFGDSLFVRRQGGMMPTPRADELAPRIRRLLMEAEEVLAPAEFDPATAEFTSYISVNDYGQSVVLLPLIAQLRRKAPGVRIAAMPFEIARLADSFRKGDIDMAITIPEMAPQDYPTRFLFSDRYVAVVRSKHPAKGPKIDLDAFCAYPHILVSPTRGAFKSATDEELRRLQRSRDVAVSVSNFRFALDLVQCDDFIAILPERLLQESRRPVRTLELPIEIKGPEAIVVWHPRYQEDPAHMWLRERISRLNAQE